MAKKDIKIVDLIDRFGKARVLKALTKRRINNKKRVEERKTGQKHMGFNKGSGENGVVYRDKKGKKITKEKAMKDFDRADAAERRERGMSKQKPYPPGMNVGGMTAGAQSALGRLQKAQMIKNESYSAKRFPLVDKEGKPKKVKPPKKEPFRDKGKGEYRKMKIGGLADYYKDII